MAAGGELPDGRRLLTVREAASLLGLSRDTVYQAIRDGLLPCHKTGATIRIQWPKHVDMYLERTEQGGEIGPVLAVPASRPSRSAKGGPAGPCALERARAAGYNLGPG